MTYSLSTFLDNVLDDMYYNTVTPYTRLAKRSVTPAINIDENNTQYIVTMPATGLDIQNFTITYEDKTLTISYKDEQHEEEKNNDENHTLLHKEFTIHREFRRSISLAKAVDSSQISARLQKGVLHITLPKKDKAEAVTIAIQE